MGSDDPRDPSPPDERSSDRSGDRSDEADGPVPGSSDPPAETEPATGSSPDGPRPGAGLPELLLGLFQTLATPLPQRGARGEPGDAGETTQDSAEDDPGGEEGAVEESHLAKLEEGAAEESHLAKLEEGAAEESHLAKVIDLQRERLRRQQGGRASSELERLLADNVKEFVGRYVSEQLGEPAGEGSGTIRIRLEKGDLARHGAALLAGLGEVFKRTVGGGGATAPVAEQPEGGASRRIDDAVDDCGSRSEAEEPRPAGGQQARLVEPSGHPGQDGEPPEQDKSPAPDDQGGGPPPLADGAGAEVVPFRGQAVEDDRPNSTASGGGQEVPVRVSLQLDLTPLLQRLFGDKQRGADSTGQQAPAQRNEPDRPSADRPEPPADPDED